MTQYVMELYFEFALWFLDFLSNTFKLHSVHKIYEFYCFDGADDKQHDDDLLILDGYWIIYRYVVLNLSGIFGDFFLMFR